MFCFNRLISSKQKRPKDNQALQPYFKRIETIYRYYVEDGRAPSPNFILRTLCDEYWREGKKLNRIGQHDSLAEILSKAISSKTDLSKILHAMLSKIIIDPHSLFADLMRAFLIYHPQFISGLESIFFSEREPDMLMDLESDIETLLSIRNYRGAGVLNVDACNALGNLAQLIPERHKNKIAELMQFCIEKGMLCDNSVVYPAMAKIASFSSEKTYEQILVFLQNESAKYRACVDPPQADRRHNINYDVKHSQGICKAFIILLNNTNDPKRRECLAESVFTHITAADDTVKIIGLEALGKVARDLSPELREKIIFSMLQMEDFLNNFEESEHARMLNTWWPHFVIVYLDVLNQFIKQSPPELKLIILSSLLKVYEKTGYTFSLEAQYLVRTFIDTAKQLPADYQKKIIYDSTKNGDCVLFCKLKDNSPSSTIASDIKMFLEASEHKDVNFRINALRGLAQLSPHYPKELLESVILAFQKGIKSNNWGINAIYSALLQLIESIPMNFFNKSLLHCAFRSCASNIPARNFLMKATEIIDETIVDSLFDSIICVMTFNHVQDNMHDTDILYHDLFEIMMQRFPGKYEETLVNFIVNQSPHHLNNVTSSIVSTAIRHMNPSDQNYTLFCHINPLIDRLKESIQVARKAGKEPFKDQNALSHLIKIKTEICYARQVNLMLNQHFSPDVSRIVMSY